MGKPRKKNKHAGSATCRRAAVGVAVVAVAAAACCLLWPGLSLLQPPPPPMPPSVLLDRCQVPGEPDRRFRIMQSTVPNSGNGVFLEEPLRVWEQLKLCIYDGEDSFKPPIRQLNTHYTMDGHVLGLEPGWVRNGYPTIQSPCGVGQIINDAARIELEAPITWRQAWAAIEECAAAPTPAP